jgi:hypothetical protein
MADKQNIFGGTSYIADQVDKPCVLGPCSSCGPCWLMDLPTSLAGDIVLLPATVTLAIIRAARKEPDPKEK